MIRWLWIVGSWRKAAGSAVLLGSALGCPTVEGKEIAVRILPAVTATNRIPLRLGLQVGFPEGVGDSLRGECLKESSLNPDDGVSFTRIFCPETGRDRFLVTNAAAVPRGVSLITRKLRQGVGCTARVRCRSVEGQKSLRFVFAPVNGLDAEEMSESVSLKRKGAVEESFSAVPQKEAVYRCGFEIKPGSVAEFEAFSLVPEDAESGWDHEALEALRVIRPGMLCWPAIRGPGGYNWYDGVGPQSVRRSVSPAGLAGDDLSFGTVEFVDFCRLVGAEPLLLVSVPHAGEGDGRITDQAAERRLAADWVAYCNATGGHPLAQLRSRHGRGAPLDVKKWAVVSAGGGALGGEVFAAYATAMQAEDPSISVVSAEDICLKSLRDRYVAERFRQLDAGPDDERRYYADWYDALGMAYGVIDWLNRGQAGDVVTGFTPEQVLFHVTQARHMLTEAGAVIELVNRYPACLPLGIDGVPDNLCDGTFRVQAAWPRDAEGLIVFVYNSGPDAFPVRLDLTALRRHFVFWVMDQLAADIAVRRDATTLPVNRVQKAGAAITQTVLCEIAPSSFTRVFVKE